MLRDRDAVAIDELGVSRKDTPPLSMTIVWAAVANTMPRGYWLIYEVLRRKDTAYKALQKEVDELFETRASDSPLTLEEADQFMGIDSAFQETIRIYSESMVAREGVHDVELDLGIPSSNQRYFLKRNSRVVIMMSTLHMDETVFPNANTFQWDRFRRDPVTGKASVFRKNGKVLSPPVKPFGGGISICPGRKFANAEIKAFVAELLHRYDLELVDDSRVEADRSRVGLGVVPPKGDVLVRVTKRIRH